jgi:hypothetical protein
VVAPGDIEFLRLVSLNLAGIVLVVDLTQLWSEERKIDDESLSQKRDQQRVLAWLLSLLRWLRFDGQYDSKSTIRFEAHVDAKARSLEKRLRVPVLVLFSKADLLVDRAIPYDQGGSFWRNRTGGAPRTLFPAGEQPFFLAYHHLRPLFDGLAEHTTNFRFDFSHSLTTERDPDTGKDVLVDPEPCGVSYSLGWLLDSSWRWPTLPTRWWVRLQRAVDYATGRGGRWRRLPEPKELAP